MGIALATASMFCWAVNIFVVRAALARMETNHGFLVLLAVNTLFAVLVTLIDLGVRDRPFTIVWGPLGLFAMAGVIGIFFGRRMLLDAITRLGPARSSALHTVTPIATAAAAWAIAGERLGPFELVVMAVVIFGLYLLQPRVSADAAHPVPRTVLWRGLAVAFFCVAGFGIANTLRGVATQSWIEPAFGSVVSSGAAFLCQLAVMRDRRGIPARLAASDRRGFWLYVASGVLTVSGSMFNSAALVFVEISIAMLVTYSTPLVVFPISLFVLKNKESLNARAVTGALLAFAGLVAIAFR